MPRSNPALSTSALALGALGALAVLWPQPAAATNGLKLTAYGPRAAGRGGVDYAFADDAIGPATNPAGMAFVFGNRFDNNWALVDPAVRWSNSLGDYDEEDKLFFATPAYSFGLVLDPSKSWEIAPIFDLGRWGLFDEQDQADGDADPAELEGELTRAATDEDLYGSRLRIGLGVFPITGGKIQLRDVGIPIDPNDPTNTTTAYGPPLDWETDILTLAVTPSLAYRFNQHFSLGFNLQLIYSRFELDGGIAQPVSRLTQSFLLGSLALSSSGQMLTAADLDDCNTYGFSGRIGLMFNSQYFSAGLVYQDRSYMQDYLGRAKVDATDEVNRLTGGLGGPAALQLIDPNIDPSRGFTGEFDARIEDLDLPRMVGLGIAIRPHRRFSFGMDYTYIHWSEVMRVFKTRLSHGNNNNLTIMTGSTIPVRVPLLWDDQHVIALGVTCLAYEGAELVEGVPSWALVLRAGYNYGSNPVPGNTTMPQQPTITEHHVSVGGTIHVGPLVEVNLAWEWALPSKVSTGNHQGNFTLANSEQQVQIHFFHFGLGFNF